MTILAERHIDFICCTCWMWEPIWNRLSMAKHLRENKKKKRVKSCKGWKPCSRRWFHMVIRGYYHVIGWSNCFDYVSTLILSTLYYHSATKIMWEMPFNPLCYCRWVHSEIKVSDCCADWMHVLQKIPASEALAAVSKQVCKKRAEPAGKCRRRLAYGWRCSQAFASSVFTLVRLPF